MAIAELWRIDAPRFVAGIEVTNGVVQQAAPIVGWTRGKLLADVMRYGRGQEWIIEKVASYAADGDAGSP